MSNRRDFVKKAGAMAMAMAVPAIAYPASEVSKEKSLSLKRPKIKVDDRWDVRLLFPPPAKERRLY